jgi:hypothetical protein
VNSSKVKACRSATSLTKGCQLQAIGWSRIRLISKLDVVSYSCDWSLTFFCLIG